MTRKLLKVLVPIGLFALAFGVCIRSPVVQSADSRWTLSRPECGTGAIRSSCEGRRGTMGSWPSSWGSRLPASACL
jgi:hypothetical protein